MVNNMEQPLISVIMPTHEPVKHLLPNAIYYFLNSEYENKELIIIADAKEPSFVEYVKELCYEHTNISPVFVLGMTIGGMRNAGCRKAQGNVILHQDCDDYFRPDWITKSVEHLLKSGADITGLSSCYFYKPNKNLYLYTEPNRNFSKKPYVVGGTLCYKKSFWEEHIFQDRQFSEDLGFIDNSKLVIAHDYINGFVAILHGNNTSSHLAVGTPEFTQLPIERIREIMGSDLERYADM